ncbi:MAG: 2-dehydropantoate 2-reductase [Caldilineaceae bacterium]|nr:2-dehydropantoate 2-reductase [Caldilineaceae bacterium]
MNQTPVFQKIAIVGVGAIGGLFAGWLGSRLPAGQIQLSAVARGDTLRALSERGLTWVDADGAEHRVAVNASDDPASLGVQDLVIISVKGPSMPAVAPAVRALMGPDTTVLVAMNGVPWWFFDGLPGAAAGLQLQTVDPGGVTAQNIPTAQVIGCVVHASATAPQPARIERIKNNQLILGEPAGGVSPRVQALSELLTQAGFGVTVSDRIQRDIWFKLWGNMTMNPVSALTRATSDKVLDDELVNAFCSNAMQEAAAIGAVIGSPIDQTPQARNAVTRKLGAMRTSMLQDADAGKTLEVDALIGVVHEIGIRTGIATPNISALYGLIRLYAASTAGAGVRPSAAG